MTTFFEYFDRTAIIHLRERTERWEALKAELEKNDFDTASPKVVVPDAPRPADANGFHSKGVYGNFLSHLQIIEAAYNDGLDSVLVLEDDAIFSNAARQRQHQITQLLVSNPWDLVFLGHSARSGFPASNSGLVRFRGEFIWAHCYAVSRRVMPTLIEYMHYNLRDPKMYIDGAYNEFRKANPDLICLLSWPCLSVQKGSPSGLGSRKFYDRANYLGGALSLARSARDELWRAGLISIGAKKDAQKWVRTDFAEPWPA